MTNSDLPPLHSTAHSSGLGRRRGACSLALVAATLLSPLAVKAGITYGRDQIPPGTTAPADYTGPVCTPGCTPSQTCTTLYDHTNPAISTNLCLNKAYPFTFKGDWQPAGHNYSVGDVVNAPVSGMAYVFVDVTASTTTSSFLEVHPPLTDTNSWRPFVDSLGLSGGAGSAGPAGPQGPAGTNGVDGAPGAPGATGPVGPQGLQGATGVQGAMGLPGVQGAMGLTGAQGNTGPQGVAGPKGDTGPIGPQGVAGAKGDTGPMGPQGVAGPKGDTGPMGSQGATGAQGPQGVQGAMGLTGAQGNTGPQGVGLFPGATILVREGVTVPAGFTCTGKKTRVRFDGESDDAPSPRFLLCTKN